jgi:UDP-N-acetylmuramoyl-tripeptide--D-alanyl-D-alanine ligase
MLKKVGKGFLCILLEAQAKRLRKRRKFLIIAVAGSVGKTSTKLAIARCLQTKERVIYQEGNYNDRLTVPLVLFGHEEPGIFNIFAWAKILLANELSLIKPYPYDAAVLEIGTDAPGQLAAFSYLQPDLTVITAVAAEHMEYFHTLDAVAEEEMTPLQYSKRALLNVDDIAAQYLPGVEHVSYGEKPGANYRLVSQYAQGLDGQFLDIRLADGKELSLTVKTLGKQGAKIILATVAIADMLGWSKEDIVGGVDAINAVPGRMQILPGKHDSVLIDDTYNASPVAVRAALDVLYESETKQRIAILGSMNELGATSEEEHRAVGAYCDPDKLSLVVTIGSEAKKGIAPVAHEKGCEVKSFLNPYDAGKFVAEKLHKNTVVLAKGSQNSVFAEEALKQLLADPSDAAKLVRQSDSWLRKKRQQFPEF